MKYLLDSHTGLWFADDSPQMSNAIKRVIENPANEKHISIASIWELAIKAATGKLNFTDPPEIYLADMIRLNNFQLLPLTFDHVTRGTSLPLHHRDPFDRVIIAQSLMEKMPIISADAIFDAYGVTRIW